jgi:hypothetical protein
VGELDGHEQVEGFPDEHGERPVAQLPAVAVGTVDDAAAPQGSEPLEVGQLVGHTGGQHQPAGLLVGAICELDHERVLLAGDARDRGVHDGDDVVAGELTAGDGTQLAR